MRIELSKRGVNGTARMDKERLRQKLRSRLTGVQRVPALLTFRPMRSIDAAGLTDYTVMPTEPLHDLKGHIAHVFTEVPNHVEKDIAAKIRHITAANVNANHARGCDWRKALFLVCHELQDNLQSDRNARQLLRLLAEVASILYAGEEDRSPRMVLHLHLCLWKHFVLLRELVQVPQSMSPGTMYGGYIHGFFF